MKKIKPKTWIIISIVSIVVIVITILIIYFIRKKRKKKSEERKKINSNKENINEIETINDNVSSSSSGTGVGTGTSTTNTNKFTFPFKTEEEGNKFREWVNDLFPDGAKQLDLERKGKLNSYLQKAWDWYGEYYLVAKGKLEAFDTQINTLPGKVINIYDYDEYDFEKQSISGLKFLRDVKVGGIKFFPFFYKNGSSQNYFLKGESLPFATIKDKDSNVYIKAYAPSFISKTTILIKIPRGTSYSDYFWTKSQPWNSVKLI